MSTTLHTPEHLSAIVCGMTKYLVIDQNASISELNAIMLELLFHNCEEHEARYPNNPAIFGEWVDFYGYKRPTHQLTAIALYKLAEAYRYNSSASQKWVDSDAERWTDSLMNRAIQSLPEYKKAKWDI